MDDKVSWGLPIPQTQKQNCVHLSCSCSELQLSLLLDFQLLHLAWSDLFLQLVHWFRILCVCVCVCVCVCGVKRQSKQHMKSCWSYTTVSTECVHVGLVDRRVPLCLVEAERPRLHSNIVSLEFL